MRKTLKSSVLIKLLFAWGMLIASFSGKAYDDSPVLTHPASTYLKKAMDLLELRKDLATTKVLIDSASVLCKEFPANTEILANYHLVNAIYLRDVAQFQESMVEINEAMQYYITRPLSRELTWCHLLTGFLKMTFSDYYGAVEEFSLSANYADSLNDAKLIYRADNGLGSSFYYLKQYSKAAEYFQKVFDFGLQTSDSLALSAASNNLGNVAVSENRNRDAATFFLQSLKFGIHRDKTSRVHAILNLAESYRQLSEYKLMKQWLDSTIVIVEQNNVLFLQGRYYSLLADYYRLTGNKEKALQMIDSAIVLTQSSNDRRMQSMFMQIKSTILGELGRYKEAFETAKKLTVLKDSIWNENVANSSNLAEQRFQAQKKVEQLKIQNLEIEQQKQTISSQERLFTLLLSVVLLLLVIGFLILLLMRKLKSSNKLLMQKNKIIESRNHELKEIIKTRDKLISIIAHDIKNPLGTISGFAELILISRSDNKDKTLEYVNHIFKGAGNLYSLLDNLLTWARSQKGAMEVKPVYINVWKIAENSVELMEDMARDKKLTLTNNIPAGFSVFADFQMIDTVFRNLITNALKFSHPGGEVILSAQQKDNFIEISVSDTGVGIEPKDVEKMFKTDSDYKRIGKHANKGSGLGLGLCHEFVIKNSGRIWVESFPGKGSTFKFTLPVERPLI